MKVFVIIALLVIGYVAASPTWAEEEELDLLERDIRAIPKKKQAKQEWGNCNIKQIKKSKVACPKGKKAEIEEDEEGNMLALRCVPCGPGEYTGNKGLFESCCACPEGKGTPEGQKDQCHAKCGPGNGWKTKGKSGKCAPCEDDTYSDEEGFECKPCPEHHKLKTKKGEKATSPSQCELKCPNGFAKTGDETFCKPCDFGFYLNKGGECKKCGEQKPYTLTNAASGLSQCFALEPESDEEACFTFLLDTLKEFGPKMKEEKKAGEKGVDGEEGPDDDDTDPAGQPDGVPGRDKRAVQNRPEGEGKPGETEVQMEGKEKKGKKAKAEEKKKQEKQERGKRLRSAICKDKGSLDEVRENFKKCKGLSTDERKLIPELAQQNNGKAVGIKEVLESEDGTETTCDDVDVEEVESVAAGDRCGAGFRAQGGPDDTSGRQRTTGGQGETGRQGATGGQDPTGGQGATGGQGGTEGSRTGGSPA